MTDNERPNLKQIRIKKSVCARLDERKGKDDSYTDVISSLIDENERLKERNIELVQDKANLTAIAMARRIDILETMQEKAVKDVEESRNKLADIAEERKAIEATMQTLNDIGDETTQ